MVVVVSLFLVFRTSTCVVGIKIEIERKVEENKKNRSLQGSGALANRQVLPERCVCVCVRNVSNQEFLKEMEERHS